MVEQRVTCDGCGAPIVEGRSLLEVTAGPLRDRIQAIDVCRQCSGRLLAWLGERPGAEVGSEPLTAG